MGNPYFVYKGVDSRDMHLIIENDVSYPSPEHDVEFVEVLGRDGDLAVNNRRLKGVDFSLPVVIRPTGDVTVSEVASKVSEWLKSDVGWHSLRTSESGRYEYTAMIYEQFDIQETLRNYGRTVLTFRLKPLKRHIGNKELIISNGTVLYNPEKRQSKPFIRISGQGDITVKKNGRDWLILRSVQDYITVDSDMMIVYKDGLAQYNKMVGILTPLFPVLDQGENQITWTGNVTEFRITPRWEAII